MSDPNQWQESNARQLADALEELRQRLERYIQEQARRQADVSPATARPSATPVPPVQPKSLTVSRSAIQQLLGRQPANAGPAATPAVATPYATPAAREFTRPAEPPSAFQSLSTRLNLSPFEENVLLLCVAMELDTRTASLCARAHADTNRPYPTFALALALFDEPNWDALSPAHPLRYYQLIEISQSGGQPLTTSPLRADERIVNYIKGLNYLDDRLSPLLSPVDFPSGGRDLPQSQQKLVETIVSRLKQVPAGQQLPVIQLLGIDAPSKQLLAAHAAGAVGLQVQRLPAALLPVQALELENLRRLWERESLLLPLALYVDALGSEIDASQASQASPISRLLARVAGVAFLDTRDTWPGMAARNLAVDVAKPTPAEQEAAWAAALGEAAAESPAQLAGQFNLGLSAIEQIAHQQLYAPAASEGSLHDRLWDACLEGARPGLDMLAERLEPKATWDDLVLPAAESNLLRQIAAQVGGRSQVYRAWGFGDKMSRGFGISALFAGDSGTGKTMAAEVIANQLRLNLYRIDLSAVVSKYIGETEKNLRRVFDKAEDGGAILFFDEADALFGKRSEVKDSHDRYANIEINYLLQRMEAYGGLAILATNMKSALDQGFMRRLRFVVTFPFPGVAQRKVMWQKAFPPKAPATGLDFDALARLNLTGGNIQSIALNAAFLAAQTGGAVTQPLLVDAARTELRKLGRIVNELEFRRQVRAVAA
jgi:hypothetical protein